MYLVYVFSAAFKIKREQLKAKFKDELQKLYG